MDAAPYTGRFAPSPTGPLHFGSLLAAVGSFLDARANNGRWLLRVEDVDRHRTVSGATDQILNSLQRHGLQWDGDVTYQSQRTHLYQSALQQLAGDGHLFYCNCTRKQLRQHGGPYPGTCRRVTATDYQPATARQPASHAIRFRVDNSNIAFNDRILGPQQVELPELGDFVLRRRDSLFAYQLAVVVDDELQGVTSVVRGADLLASTPWQICLQRALGYRIPDYAHLPLVIHAGDGDKLSKQTGAAALNDEQASSNMVRVLGWLNQPLPGHAQTMDCGELLAHAIAQWDLARVPRQAVAHGH